MAYITLIICTKDRPRDLSTLFQSISAQTRRPDEIIVIDGSDSPIQSIVESVEGQNIRYQLVRPPGLTKQRNVGLSMLSEETQWVGFLDDDLVLENNAIENLNTFIELHADVVGVGLAINNQPEVNHVWLKRLFLTDVGMGGKMTLSGMPAPIRSIKQDQEVDWIYGGATFWRRELFKTYRFDEWFSGVAYLEDVDFSYQVSRNHKLMLCSTARCFHYHHPVGKEKFKNMGAWRMVSYWYFVNKYKNFNILLVLWSMLGVIVNNLLVGILRPSSHRILRCLGNLEGIRLILTGQAKSYKGFQK